MGDVPHHSGATFRHVPIPRSAKLPSSYTFSTYTAAGADSRDRGHVRLLRLVLADRRRLLSSADSSTKARPARIPLASVISITLQREGG